MISNLQIAVISCDRNSNYDSIDHARALRADQRYRLQQRLVGKCVFHSGFGCLLLRSYELHTLQKNIEFLEE
jgi:hypothetical protein